MLANDSKGWLTLARIVRPQGRKGEVLADVLTDFPDLFASTHLALCDPGGERQSAAVEHHWMPTGRSAGRIVLKISGTNSISDAEKLSRYEVQVPAEERVALDSLTYYVSDLQGCQLLDGDTMIGTVVAVEFPTSADGRRLEDSAPLFVVARSSGGEALIPFVKAFVQHIDVAEKQIVMSLPDGLVELNG